MRVAVLVVMLLAVWSMAGYAMAQRLRNARNKA